MAKRAIILKPVITEKSEILSDKGNRYTFVVHKSANKIEIKKAIEEMYNVSVSAVNTMVMPAKAKRRMTRTGVTQGRVSSYKKAVISLPEGEEIDFYGEI